MQQPQVWVCPTYLLQFRSISKGVKLYFFMSKLETRATNNEVDSPREEKSTHLLPSMPKKTTTREPEREPRRRSGGRRGGRRSRGLRFLWGSWSHCSSWWRRVLQPSEAMKHSETFQASLIIKWEEEGTDTNNAVSSSFSHQQWIHRYFSVALPLWSFCARVRFWRYQNRIFRFWNNLIWITEQLLCDKDKRISCRKIPYFKNSLYVIYWRLFFFCPCWHIVWKLLKISH